jgi:hypothetical protein
MSEQQEGIIEEEANVLKLQRSQVHLQSRDLSIAANH